MTTSFNTTTNKDSKYLSRSETGNRKDVHDRSGAAAAFASHHFMDIHIQPDMDDQEKVFLEQKRLITYTLYNIFFFFYFSLIQ